MQHSISGNGLGDVLERVLDKGVVVAGDVQISLVGVELLTIKLRLVVASVDKAMEMGLRWWDNDPYLAGGGAAAPANAALQQRVAALENQLAAMGIAPEEAALTEQDRG